MATRTRVRFSKSEFRKELMARKSEIDKLQTAKLIAYAESEMPQMAALMLTDTTGNLLDSLCWGVWYNGKLAKLGYYREQQEAELDSYLHELSANRVPINGRFLAQQFLAQYKPTIKQGWEVVWGVLAPYWAYWEQGHYNRLLGDVVQFKAMSQRYDHIKQELEPMCKVTFEVNVPQ